MIFEVNDIDPKTRDAIAIYDTVDVVVSDAGSIWG